MRTLTDIELEQISGGVQRFCSERNSGCEKKNSGGKKGSDGQIFCTQDVKLCPDGSYVGRIPPSCEFAPCPGGSYNA